METTQSRTGYSKYLVIGAIPVVVLWGTLIGIQLYFSNNTSYATLYRHVKKIEEKGLVTKLNDGTRFEASDEGLKVIIPNAFSILDKNANGLRKSEELSTPPPYYTAESVLTMYEKAVKEGIKELVNK